MGFNGIEDEPLMSKRWRHPTLRFVSNLAFKQFPENCGNVIWDLTRCKIKAF